MAETLEKQPLTFAAVVEGLPARAVKGYIRAGRLREADVFSVVPKRTFERRLSGNQPLKLAEADAIARLLRVRDHALGTFGRAELAEEWLTLPNPELHDRVPIEMARTDLGAREVEAVLGRIEHGVFS